MSDGPDPRPSWDGQSRLDAELSRRTPSGRARKATSAGAAVPRGWAPDVSSDAGLRELVRKIDASPPTFQRGFETLAALPELKHAGGVSRADDVLANLAAASGAVGGGAALLWAGWAVVAESPPGLVALLAVIGVVIFLAAMGGMMFGVDRGRELPIEADGRTVARVLPPAGAGGRLFVRVRRDGGDTAVSLIHLALRPGSAYEGRIEWRTVADQRFGRGEELLLEDCVAEWSELAAVHAHLDRRGIAAADKAAALARHLSR
ncbi:hypothetical protein DSM112329_02234 [Paraconexibacter sp. AEG42_29]|uniref:Uncharacterized protein n=1 Tax=Paraconexibacter sp. AEG42_29 TaxID=2997339 RepID=A0AAU7AUK5_9ACTN